MGFKEQVQADLGIFYNTDEFAVNALYKQNEISVIFEDDEEVGNTKEKLVSAISADVNGLALGDTFEIETITYEVFNFDFKDNTKLEMLIALKKS